MQALRRAGLAAAKASNACKPSDDVPFTLSFARKAVHTLADIISPAHFGQPVPSTHPWLLRENECAPGITFDELKRRRRQLGELMAPGAVAILPSSLPQYMAGVIPYPYRQDADFRYLTGIVQQGVAVLHKPSTAAELHYTLLLPDRSPDRAVWDGHVMTPDAAIEQFGADEAMPLTEAALSHALTSKVRHASAVLLDRDRPCPILHRCLPEILKTAGVGSAVLPPRRKPATLSHALGLMAAPPKSVNETLIHPLRPLLHSLRWVKSPAERGAMAAAVELGTRALRTCMAVAHEGMMEREVAALFEFQCASGGASRLAYPSVVASGPDAMTIHYGRNDKRLEPHALLLMDAGCELWGYSSDVTRTWPISGRFSESQRRVYAAVLEVHRACLAECKPGALMRDIHHLSTELLSDALHELGVKHPGGGRLAVGEYRDFYPHSIGHWLGLDTHDASLILQDTPLREGCVLTIEPGLYLPAGPRVPPDLAGIGVRIEDDVVITADGARVLSDAAPIDVEEVEELAGSRAGAWRVLNGL